MRDAMSTHKIITELLDENMIGAKKQISDTLYEKLGEHLNAIYKDIAPTLISEKKKSHKEDEEEDEEEGTPGKKQDMDGDGDIDSADYKAKKSAAIKAAIAKRKKGKKK